jgi:hypothetical protein
MNSLPPGFQLNAPTQGAYPGTTRDPMGAYSKGLPEGFQLNAPQPQQQPEPQAAAAPEQSWGDAFRAASENAPRPLEFIKSQFTNPIEDIKHMAGLGRGLANKVLGTEASPEDQQAADQTLKHYGNYFSEAGLKENISQDPIGTATDVVSLGFPAARAGLNTLRRGVTPIPARPGFEDAHQVLQREGVPQTAGQRTGSERLKFAESELGGGRTSQILDQQKEAYTAAASRRIGDDTPHLGPQELEASYRRIGGGIGNISRRNTLQPDPALMPEVTNVVGEYHNLIGTPAPIVQRYADFIATRTRGGTAPLPGGTYQAMRSRLGRYAREATEPHLQRAMYGLQNALDDAFERGLQRTGNAADYEALRGLRRDYGNYLTLENTMRTGAGDTARGLVTPPKLESAASTGANRRRYAHGQSDFTELAKAGRVGMSPMPNSGTPARVAAQAIPAAIGAALGFGGGGGIGAVAGGIAGKFAAGRALMSRPVQGYLGNQLLPNRIPGALGYTAPTIAMTAADRKRNLDHAGKVLSPEVLTDMKRVNPKELNAWVSNPSPETAQALAQIIAKRVNRPDLVERITAELSGQ